MSLVPVIDGSPWQGLPGSQHLFDQHFGMGLNLGDLVAPAPTHIRPGYYRPWRYASTHRVGKGTVTVDKDGFHVMMDVQQFTLEDITVKHQGDHVVVEGKHNDKADAHGYISRHFVRRYVLPKTVNGDALQSTISSDGVLTVTAPKMPRRCVTDRRRNYLSTKVGGMITVVYYRKDDRSRPEWLKNIPRKDWNPSSGAVYYVKHFDAGYILRYATKNNAITMFGSLPVFLKIVQPLENTN